MHEYNVFLMNEMQRQEAARQQKRAEWRREARAAQPPGNSLFASLSALLRRRFSLPVRPAVRPLQTIHDTQEIPC